MFTKSDNINLVIPRSAIEVVFGECDRYDADETGGRILGTYQEIRNELTITVSGIIEPGPGTRRTGTFLKQDGAWQEQVFRQVEEREPSIEHLGNWHTHHVNGLSHLSGGDIETYRRTVEHKNHNTNFFYALLVIEKKSGKSGLQRYIFKNYVFRRGDPQIYEIPASALTLTGAPLVWPMAGDPEAVQELTNNDGDAVKKNRVYDRDIVGQFYPKVGTFKSKELGIYWRGPIGVVDGSELEVVVIEDVSGAVPQYTVTLRNPPEALAGSAQKLGRKSFPSCRAALVATERLCNSELFEKHQKAKGKRKWIF